MQCVAITTYKKQCSRKASPLSTCCWQHLNSYTNIVKPKIATDVKYLIASYLSLSDLVKIYPFKTVNKIVKIYNLTLPTIEDAKRFGDVKVEKYLLKKGIKPIIDNWEFIKQNIDQVFNKLKELKQISASDWTSSDGNVLFYGVELARPLKTKTLTLNIGFYTLAPQPRLGPTLEFQEYVEEDEDYIYHDIRLNDLIDLDEDTKNTWKLLYLVLKMQDDYNII